MVNYLSTFSRTLLQSVVEKLNQLLEKNEFSFVKQADVSEQDVIPPKEAPEKKTSSLPSFSEIHPTFLNPVLTTRYGLRELDRKFSESYPFYFLDIVKQRLAFKALGIRWAADLPQDKLIDDMHQGNYLALVSNATDESLAKNLKMPFISATDYLRSAFMPRHKRRNIAILNTDFVNQLLLCPDLLQTLVHHLDESLFLPLTIPLVENAVLWDANWSAPRAGIFTHRRINHVSHPASIHLLGDFPDWQALPLSFKIWTNQPSNVLLRLESPQGYDEWDLTEQLTQRDISILVKEGRNPLHFRCIQKKPRLGLFVDIGCGRINDAGSFDSIPMDFDDDGELLIASIPSALHRLHSFGFLSSFFDVYSRGVQIESFSGTGATRLSNLSVTIDKQLDFHSQATMLPRRATVIFRLLRAKS